jgi:post-segregation antitoxin (ccd killing protein)
MRKITAYQTADGLIHISAPAAKAHSKDRHYKALSALALSMVNATGSSYSKSMKWLMENRHTIAAMSKLFDDTELVADDEEE